MTSTSDVDTERPRGVARHLRIELPVMAFVIILSVLATNSRASNDTARESRAECTLHTSQIPSQRTLSHLLSRNAELIAPSGRGVTTESGKRRAVGPPSTPSLVSRNFIDSEIFARMVRDGVAWTARSSDEEYLRRVSIDLTGQIPTGEKVKSFIADSAADKRDTLLDELLNSDGFVDRWTLWFGDLVGNIQESANIRQSYLGRNAYYYWIRDAFASGKPYDEMVRASITAVGGSFTSAPAANYWVRRIQSNGPIQDTYDNVAVATAEHFLALPLGCLSCHDGRGHLETVNLGLASRTRHDFWKNAAFFAQSGFTTLKTDPVVNEAEYILSDNSTGAYRLNTNYGNKTTRSPAGGRPNVVEPEFFLSGEGPRKDETRREAYARLLTSNPQFARASVNYVWKTVFGLGIVEPADSFDLLRQDATALPPGATLQPTHPELLEKLSDYFVTNAYDLRALLKLIMESNTYQLSSRYTPGEWDERWTVYYARHYPRRLLAESVLDAVGRATGTPLKLGVRGVAAPMDRALALPDPTEPVLQSEYVRFLAIFGRGDRDTTPRSDGGSVLQALEILNGRVVSSRFTPPGANATVARIIASTNNPATIVDELYIATLSRRPSATERAAAIEYLSGGDLGARAAELQHAVVNCVEFLFN